MNLNQLPWVKTQIGQPTRAEATYKHNTIKMTTGYDIVSDGYMLHTVVNGTKVEVPPTNFATEDDALNWGYGEAVRIIDSIGLTP